MENKANIEELKKEIKRLAEMNKKFKTDFKLSDTRLSFYCLNKGEEVFEILGKLIFNVLL